MWHIYSKLELEDHKYTSTYIMVLLSLIIFIKFTQRDGDASFHELPLLPFWFLFSHVFHGRQNHRLPPRLRPQSPLLSCACEHVLGLSRTCASHAIINQLHHAKGNQFYFCLKCVTEEWKIQVSQIEFFFYRQILIAQIEWINKPYSNFCIYYSRVSQVLKWSWVIWEKEWKIQNIDAKDRGLDLKQDKFF